MDFHRLLPVGSVVLLKNAQKKSVIMGIMPVKHKEDGSDQTYDYMGVPYPEGFIGSEAGLLFDHDSIEEVCLVGYDSEERKIFMEALQGIVDSAEQAIRQRETKTSI